MFPKVTDVFLAGKWVRFTLPLHPHGPAITRLMSSDYLDMIWKEIEGKNHSTPACPWPRCLPAHIPPASGLALAITGMFLLRRPLTSAWISSEICPGKGAGTVHLTSVPIIQISLENPLGKCFPPSNESVWICTQRQQLNLAHGNQSLDYWISKPTMGTLSPPACSSPHPRLCLSSDTFHLDSQTSFLDWFPIHN